MTANQSKSPWFAASLQQSCVEPGYPQSWQNSHRKSQICPNKSSWVSASSWLSIDSQFPFHNPVRSMSVVFNSVQCFVFDNHFKSPRPKKMKKCHYRTLTMSGQDAALLKLSLIIKWEHLQRSCEKKPIWVMILRLSPSVWIKRNNNKYNETINTHDRKHIDTHWYTLHIMAYAYVTYIPHVLHPTNPY